MRLSDTELYQFIDKKYNIGEILKYIPAVKNTPKKVWQEVDSISVAVTSSRLRTFRIKGCDCVMCGRKGTHFRIQARKDTPFYLGLWSDDDVEMTRDHIIPKSKGGPNNINNYQTLCLPCNWKKADTMPELMAA